jgi:hypothetical protein
MEEQVQRGPAESFMVGLGAARFEGYKLGYTDGVNADLDMAAIRLAATQQEVDDAKIRPKKKFAQSRRSSTPITPSTTPRGDMYRKGTSKQQFDKFLPPTAK